MVPSCASSANVGPVMPGAAAFATAVSISAAAQATRGSSFIGFALLVVVANMAIPLVDAHFGHLPAKVLCVVRQMIEIRRVQVIGPRRDRSGARGGWDRGRRAHQAGVQDDVQGLAAAERD